MGDVDWYDTEHGGEGSLVTVCANVAGKSSYIKEFLAFYFAVGVRNFMLLVDAEDTATNNKVNHWKQSDFGVRVKQVLLDKKDTVKPTHQLTPVCKQHWKAARSSTFLMVVGTDEFVFPRHGLSLVNHLSSDACASARLNGGKSRVKLRLFGSDGHMRMPGVGTLTGFLTFSEDAQEVEATLPHNAFRATANVLSAKITDPKLYKTEQGRVEALESAGVAPTSCADGLVGNKYVTHSCSEYVEDRVMETYTDVSSGVLDARVAKLLKQFSLKLRVATSLREAIQALLPAAQTAQLQEMIDLMKESANACTQSTQLFPLVANEVSKYHHSIVSHLQQQALYHRFQPIKDGEAIAAEPFIQAQSDVALDEAALGRLTSQYPITTGLQRKGSAPTSCSLESQLQALLTNAKSLARTSVDAFVQVRQQYQKDQAPNPSLSRPTMRLIDIPMNGASEYQPQLQALVSNVGMQGVCSIAQGAIALRHTTSYYKSCVSLSGPFDVGSLVQLSAESTGPVFDVVWVREPTSRTLKYLETVYSSTFHTDVAKAFSTMGALSSVQANYELFVEDSVSSTTCMALSKRMCGARQQTEACYGAAGGWCSLTQSRFAVQLEHSVLLLDNVTTNLPALVHGCNTASFLSRNTTLPLLFEFPKESFCALIFLQGWQATFDDCCSSSSHQKDGPLRCAFMHELEFTQLREEPIPVARRVLDAVSKANTVDCRLYSAAVERFYALIDYVEEASSVTLLPEAHRMPPPSCNEEA
eukprot:m.192892 g.192892  ORF g.192892 m.192892 type:complete len:756 (+) comp14868_c0_seq1:794-3061(+)